MGILRRLREWREDKDGTLIGPNIDAGSVNTDETTLTERYRETAEASDADTDSGTALSLDLTGLADQRQYTLIIALEGQGGGTESDLNIRVDNDTGTNYNQSSINASTLSSSTGNTEWQTQFTGSREYLIAWDIGLPNADGSTPIPTISQRQSGENVDNIVSGRYTNGVFSSIQLTTSSAATGEAVIVGGEIL